MKAKYFFGAVGQGSRVKLIVNMIMGEFLIIKRIFSRLIMSHRIVSILMNNENVCSVHFKLRFMK